MQVGRKNENLSQSFPKRLKIFQGLTGIDQEQAPTRHLKLRNLNPLIGFEELETECRKSGDVRILDTQNLHKGEAVVSYFDIRHSVLGFVFFSQRFETSFLPDPPFQEFSDIIFIVLSCAPEDFGKFSETFSVVCKEKDEVYIRFHDLRKCWSTLRLLEKLQNQKGKNCGKKMNLSLGNKENLGPCAKKCENLMKYVIDYSMFWVKRDPRTTLMIKNIPNKYSQQMLLDSINKNHSYTYDFLYLPIDFKNRCNVGYAFINFVDFRYIYYFYEEFDGKKWEKFKSEKVCALSYARIQGRNNLEKHFQTSNIMAQEFSMRPLMLLNGNYLR